MAFLSRKTPPPAGPFWQVPPFESSDVQVLYRHGTTCVGKSDWKGMMSTGWAIWNLSGLDTHQAKDFLMDGYKGWLDSPATDFEINEFLVTFMRRLRDIHPEIALDADVWSLPRHVAESASTYYSARCWAGSELLSLMRGSGEYDASLEEEVFRGLRQTHRAFMPPRSMDDYRRLRSDRGLADPWS